MFVGGKVAQEILKWRDNDGSKAPAPEYVLPPLPGLWQPTPPAFQPPSFPQFGDVLPFGLLTSTQYLPAPPPTLTSAAYAADVDEVKRLGSATNSERTAEQTLLADGGVKVTHCPGSNLKLGSGIAPVAEMRARGVSFSLGADGAACNNHLDMFGEMRLAATLQSIRRSPGALSARDVLWMATRAGAAALGLEGEIGSIEAGRKADLILVDTASPRLAPSPDPFSAIVYSAQASDVTMTMVGGEVLVQDGALLHLDRAEITAEARAEAAALARRAL